MQRYCLKHRVKGAAVKPSMNIVEHVLFRKNNIAHRNGRDPAIKALKQNYNTKGFSRNDWRSCSKPLLGLSLLDSAAMLLHLQQILPELSS